MRRAVFDLREKSEFNAWNIWLVEIVTQAKSKEFFYWREEVFETLGISMVKNENDVIEAFVRHNLNYLDAMLILDNGSIDGTRATLVALQKEGLPIVIFDDPIVGYFQSEKVTSTLRRAVKHFKPRFIFPLDADEFISTPSREVFVAQLRHLPPGSQGIYFWKTYIPSPDSSSAGTGDVLRDLTHRRKTERPQYSKSIIACHPEIDSSLVVSQGGHLVKVDGRSLPVVVVEDISLAHFPVRSISQVTSKALVGWMAYLSRNPKESQRSPAGYQWRRLYEIVVRGKGLRDHELTDEALAYAQEPPFLDWPDGIVEDPVPPGYASLRYQAKSQASTLQQFARSVERLFLPDPCLEPEFLKPRVGAAVSKNRKNSSPTAFTEKWHQNNLYVDIPPFRFVADRYHPRTVLDLGCGVGAYLSFFMSQGAQSVLGVDSFDMQEGFINHEDYLNRDLGSALDLGGTFDLVVCVEVIEHLDTECAINLINTITKHADKRIVFSAGKPGQPGIGHINLQPISHWLDAFEERGWFVSLFDTLAVRSLATFSWFRQNLVMLDRCPDHKNVIRSLLEKTGAAWEKEPADKPACVMHPMTEVARLLQLQLS